MQLDGLDHPTKLTCSLITNSNPRVLLIGAKKSSLRPFFFLSSIVVDTWYWFDILFFCVLKPSFAFLDIHAGAASKLALIFIQGKNKNGKEGSGSSGSR